MYIWPFAFLYLKCDWKCKGTRRANTILTKTTFLDLTLLDLNTYSRAMLIKTVWYRHKNDTSGKNENSEINPHIYD